MRWAILAASVATAALASSVSLVWAAPQPQRDNGAQSSNGDAARNAAPTTVAPVPNAAPAAAGEAHHDARPGAPAEGAFTPAAVFRATAPPNADPTRTYAQPSDAILAGDLDYLVRRAHSQMSSGDATAMWPMIAFADDFAAGNLPEARAVLAHADGGVHGGLADLVEPFLLAGEGRADFGVERVDHGDQDLPGPLPDVQRGLVFEAAGRLQEAAAVYSAMESHVDVTPPGDTEPSNLQEFQRSLNATRVTHALYRAALVQHRLGHADEARRLYNLVEQFSPHSADVDRNLARLAQGQPPAEPPLTPQTAAGRWLLFLSDYISQSEGLSQALTNRNQPPHTGLSSATGALFMQIGVALAPDAQDWRLFAAQQLVAAGGLDGAERVIDLMPQDSVFAPDAEIIKASIQLQRHNDQAAVAAARHAIDLGSDRWPVIVSAGDVFRMTGHSPEATAAFDRALTMAHDAKDRANILGLRAYAHRFAGEQAAATADMRAAYGLDQSTNTRMLYVSILMDDSQAWHDGIQVARGLFAEDPDSVTRLNALGYALIQHPQGLEEGYRLLWRGFNNGQQDYSVVDSLGWAYYLYGAFDEARSLCERARDLSVSDPNPEILDHLGDIYWRLNRRDDARESWRHALDARPDTPRRTSLQAKIAHGITAAAPRHQTLPTVTLPQGPAERGDT